MERWWQDDFDGGGFNYRFVIFVYGSIIFNYNFIVFEMVIFDDFSFACLFLVNFLEGGSGGGVGTMFW